MKLVFHGSTQKILLKNLFLVLKDFLKSPQILSTHNYMNSSFSQTKDILVSSDSDTGVTAPLEGLQGLVTPSFFQD